MSIHQGCAGGFEYQVLACSRIFMDSVYIQVLISYNWGAQNMAIKLRDVLLAQNLKVWIDVDNKGPDIIASMGEVSEGGGCEGKCRPIII